MALCIFCIKSSISVTGASISEHKAEVVNGSDHRVDGKGNVVKSFINLLERFVGEGVSKITKDRTCSEDKGVNDCCRDCEIIIKSFCGAYHEWRCLELRLEWKLQTLVSVMKLANRVPSRVRQLKCSFKEAAGEGYAGRRLEKQVQKEGHPDEGTSAWELQLSNFKSFRKNLIKKCIRRLSKSQPKVLLVDTKYTNDGVTLDENIRKPTSSLFPLGNFLGWIMSFSALVSLATMETAPFSRESWDADELMSLSPGRTFFADDIDTDLDDDERREILSTGSEDGSDMGTQTYSRCGFVEDASLKREEVADAKEFHVNIDEEDPASPPSDKGPQEDCYSDFGNDEGPLSGEAAAPAEGPECDTQRQQQLSAEMPENKFPPSQVQDAIAMPIKSESEHQLITTTNNEFSAERKHRCAICKLSYKSYGALRRHQGSKSHRLIKARFLRKNRKICTTLATKSCVITCPQSSSRLHAVKFDVNTSRTNDTQYTSHGSVQETTGYSEHEGVIAESTNSAGDGDIQKTPRAELIGTSTPTKPSRYNLRENRKRSYHLETLEQEEEDDQSANDSDVNSEAYSSEGSSASDTETSICDQDQADADKPLSRTRFACGFDGCVVVSNRKELFEEHQKLHAPGQFNCKFCAVIEGSVIQLGEHERIVHARFELGSSDTVLHCPRCPFETRKLTAYQHHFAEKHIGGFSFNMGKVECPICSVKVWKIRQEHHFQQLHDTTGMEPEEIWRCEVKDCPAFFKAHLQLRRHRKVHSAAHKFPESEEDTSSSSSCSDSGGEEICNEAKSRKRPRKASKKLYYCRMDGCIRHWTDEAKFQEHQRLHTPGHYQCSFCDKVMDNIAKLCRHELHIHSSQTNPSDNVSRCPRCRCEWTHYTGYMSHFVKVHIDGFKKQEPEEQAKHLIQATKKALNPNSMLCEICNMNILKSRKEIHFKEYHDTSGMNAEQIRKCNVVDCTAFFKTKVQRYAHLLNEHKVFPPSGDDDKIVAPQAAASVVHKSKTLVCHCGQSFNHVQGLESHERLHGSWSCKFCDVVKDYAPHLAIHEAEHAPEKSQEGSSEKKQKSENFICPHCRSGFFRKWKYIRHYLEKHLNLQSYTVIPTVCPICKATSIGMGRMGVKNFHRTHFQVHHNTDGMDPAEIQRCDKCPAYFVKSDQLNQHKFHIHYEKKCPVCGKLFARNPSDFRSHVEKMHPLVNLFPHLVYTCDIKSCTKRFGTERELSHHKKNGVHYNDEMMQCSKCDKEYKGERKLRAHMRIAHAAHSHICSECGKTFKSKPHLQLHMDYHKGPEAWKFECSTCGKKCADKYKLTAHMRTHTKEKPYVCQCCGEKYAHRPNWLGHMRTKHKEEFSELEQGASGRTKIGSYLSRKGSKKGDCITAGVKQV